MEAISETQVNLKEIENDLKQGLENANNDDNDSNQVKGVDALKPRLDLNKLTVKSMYKVKKIFQLKILSRDVPKNIKPKLSHLSKVEDREAEIIKTVLDHYGSNHLTPEMIDMINKYINTPMWPLLEMELELHEKMKADIEVIVLENRGE